VSHIQHDALLQLSTSDGKSFLVATATTKSFTVSNRTDFNLSYISYMADMTTILSWTGFTGTLNLTASSELPQIEPGYHGNGGEEGGRKW